MRSVKYLLYNQYPKYLRKLFNEFTAYKLQAKSLQILNEFTGCKIAGQMPQTCKK